MADDDGDWIAPRPLFTNEMDYVILDFGEEMRPAVQMIFPRPPIIVVEPIVHQLPHGRIVRAILPRFALRHIGPPRRRKAISDPVDLRIVDFDPERLYGHGQCFPSLLDVTGHVAMSCGRLRACKKSVR